ncbi:septum formation initiator family protein [Cereibacter azotoformans]|uniref:Septum formation initiator n=1 Tax=Cereibacter azotoformans TaxID=43057 RepID=A0A2T5K9G3_9RHOB|nr:septum formation initiator family protein [Cereibacter azotoformans]AXQ93247.1 septum formation initiator family protein [Cereibacter sphaeroides]MBO4169094.1 septum formation initiator family protein [Cereibacter azotoformans]PTR19029.1 septum formation initiator [Cereibacter azotoformans]UIJ31561.1 septum formation initiator family protein [Cereibacter azotoformans]
MNIPTSRPAIGASLYFALAFSLSAYFTFAAVQGDYGVFRQVQIKAEAEALRAERDQIAAELAEMRNKTRRLSDSYLDVDLLDEQARATLGYVRADEIVIR